MAVKIARLFKDAKFSSFSTEVKLLYIYLATHPDLNTVGVFSPNIDVAIIESGLSEDEFRGCLKLLTRTKKIYVKKFEDTVYFIVPDHFNTIPKSEASVKRVNKALKGLPDGLVTFLASIGISSNNKVKSFVKPTAKEVSDYAFEFGYLVNGQEFVDYYEQMAVKYGKKHWVDSRGTQVRDWKAKLRKIWFKPEKLLKTFDDAPEGFEKFYVQDGDKIICPDGWRAGKPYSKNVVIDMKLKKEYEKRKRSST